MAEDACPSCDKTYPDSTQVPWRWDEGRHETYVFVLLKFDIDLAKRILQEKPHPIQYADEARLAPLFEERRSGGESINIFGHGVSPKEDISKCEIDIPIIYGVILSPEGERQGMLIDGIHRVNRRAEVGCKTFPVVALTPEETAYIASQYSEAEMFKRTFKLSKAEAQRKAKEAGLPSLEARARPPRRRARAQAEAV